MTFVNTRPLQYVRELSSVLAGVGLESFEFPATELSPVDADSVNLLFPPDLKRNDWFIFSSRSGVEFLNRWLRAKGGADEALKTFDSVSIAAIGDATGDAVRRSGARVTFRPEKSTGIEFAKEFLALPAADVGRCFVIRGESGSVILRDTLRAAGKNVDDKIVYRTVPHLPKQEILDELCAGLEINRFSGIIFASGEGVRNTVSSVSRLCPPEALSRLLCLPAAVIGKPTRLAAEQHRFSVRWIPESPNFQQLVSLLVES